MNPASFLVLYAAGPGGGAYATHFVLVGLGVAGVVVGLREVERKLGALRRYRELDREAEWNEQVADHLEFYDLLFALTDPGRREQVREHAQRYRQTATRMRQQAQELWDAHWALPAKPSPSAAGRQAVPRMVLFRGRAAARRARTRAPVPAGAVGR